MKKINIELDMLHFMVAYQYLLLASKHKHSQKKVGFNHMIFREAFEEIDKQFTKQYTEEHGETNMNLEKLFLKSIQNKFGMLIEKNYLSETNRYIILESKINTNEKKKKRNLERCNATSHNCDRGNTARDFLSLEES
jgi:hypothetical protein